MDAAADLDHEGRRPWERRSAARTAVVWDALRQRLGAEGLRIVDIGGGTGGFAVRIAELGHEVTLIDPSPDALAAADRRAVERGVSERVHGVQGDLTDLGEFVEPAGADLVLCHDVLGVLDDPAEGLRSIATAVRSGGCLSLVVGQRHAAVLAAAMIAQFDRARELLDAMPSRPHLFDARECARLVGEAGFEVDTIHGVRVFADLVPSSLVDGEAGAASALLELERAAADRPEYLAMATQLHVLATRE
jgi:SAM-dependent methyltransferase